MHEQGGKELMGPSLLSSIVCPLATVHIHNSTCKLTFILSQDPQSHPVFQQWVQFQNLVTLSVQAQFCGYPTLSVVSVKVKILN